MKIRVTLTKLVMGKNMSIEQRLITMFELEPKRHNECFNAETQFVFESALGTLSSDDADIITIQKIKEG